jgi:hypothetical protein
VGKEKEINVLVNMLVIGAQMATDIEDQLTTLNKLPAEKQITLGLLPNAASPSPGIY